jgi:UDP-2,3-diacylglucosamine pyrophosphatase LpxH
MAASKEQAKTRVTQIAQLKKTEKIDPFLAELQKDMAEKKVVLVVMGGTHTHKQT